MVDFWVPKHVYSYYLKTLQLIYFNVTLVHINMFVKESPIITKDPQSKYRSEGENVTLCCQTEPAVGVTNKW